MRILYCPLQHVILNVSQSVSHSSTLPEQEVFIRSGNETLPIEKVLLLQLMDNKNNNKKDLNFRNMKMILNFHGISLEEKLFVLLHAKGL